MLPATSEIVCWRPEQVGLKLQSSRMKCCPDWGLKVWNEENCSGWLEPGRADQSDRPTPVSKSPLVTIWAEESETRATATNTRRNTGCSSMVVWTRRARRRRRHTKRRRRRRRSCCAAQQRQKQAKTTTTNKPNKQLLLQPCQAAMSVSEAKAAIHLKLINHAKLIGEPALNTISPD